MLDLNVDVVFPVECALEVEAETATADSLASTTTSTTNNTVPSAAVDEVVDCSSSALRNTVSTLNFSIMDKGVIEIEDGVNNDEVADSRNELQLFPMRAPSLCPSPSPSLLTARYWLNLSAPDAVDGGGLELGMYKAQLATACDQVQKPQVKKSRRGPRSRSSQYRGVTFYRRTGRWESHIWDCGKQVYLGGFDTAHTAARAYDRAAIKFRGVDADINFTISDYEEDMKQIKNLSKEEFVHILRRQSTGFSRGSSKYRGIAMNKCGQWEARMSQFFGKKYMYPGLFDSEAEAARPCDRAAIKCSGREAVKSFEPSNYERDIIHFKGEGSGSNLDLNLGMSLSSDVAVGNSITSDLQFSHTSNESPGGKRSKVETASGSPQKLGMSTDCAPMWAAGIYSSGFAPNVKEREIRGDAIPLLSGFTKWTVKMGSSGSGMISPSVPILSSSTAASSRFSPASLLTSLNFNTS